MKKLIVSIFAIFYLFLSTGATIHLHYCMGRFVEWRFWQDSKSDKCGKCGMTKEQKKANKGCCKDEQEFIKIVNDQKVSPNAEPAFQNTFVAITSSFPELPSILVSFGSDKNPVSHAPPRSNDAGIYLLNCVFRI